MIPSICVIHTKLWPVSGWIAENWRCAVVDVKNAAEDGARGFLPSF